MDRKILFKFHQYVVKILIYNVWRDLRLPISTLATLTVESFNGKFTAEIDLPVGYFILTLLNMTLEV